MNYYYVSLEDYSKTSWVLHEVVKKAARHPRPSEMPSVFYKFFRSADVEVRMKSQYQHLVCKKCGRYESDAAFEIGYDDRVSIQFKGDYGYTNDRTFVINEKFLETLDRANVGGYKTKPLGKSGWHALRVTQLVKHVDGVVKNRKPLCTECGRPAESFGCFHYCDELSLPTETNTFFTTITGWPSSHFCDREIYLTEDVLQALKNGGIVGGYCNRLWTDAEKKQQKEKTKQGVNFWWPPKTSVRLNGKKK
jgi:hypothetical protein